ncbi:MAG: diguanylate cyclase domain-containing protein [Proteocatella sp.]
MENYYELSELDSSELLNHLKTAIEVAKIGIWKWNLSDNKIYFSPECFVILGLNPNEFQNSLNYLVENIIHEDSKQEFLESINLAINKNIVSDKEYRVINTKQKYCWVKIKSHIIYENDTPVKLIGIMMDISEYKKNKFKVQDELNFIKTLIDIIPNPIFYKNAQGLYEYTNKSFEDFIGFNKEQIINKSVFDLFDENLAKIYKKADDDLFASKEKQIYESKVKDTDGTLRDVIFNKAVHIVNGNSVGIVGVIQDVTEQRKMQKELKKLYEAKEIFLKLNKAIIEYKNESDFLHEVMMKFSYILEYTEQCILLEVNDEEYLSHYDSHGLKIIDENSRMLFKDSYIYALTNIDYEKVYIQSLIDISDFPDDDPSKDVVSQNKLKSVMYIPIMVNSKIKWFFIYSSSKDNAYSDSEYSLADYVRSEISNIIQVFQLYQQTLNLSRFDGLTGLMNRRYFDENLEETLQNNHSDFAVIIIDLDKLKIINDQLGHLKGDYYIKLIANLLSVNFKNNGFWGRLGGDEFAGIVFELNKDLLIGTLEKIKNEYKNILSKDTDRRFQFSFSYGISYNSESPCKRYDLLKLADDRLYIYKLRGGI